MKYGNEFRKADIIFLQRAYGHDVDKFVKNIRVNESHRKLNKGIFNTSHILVKEGLIEKEIVSIPLDIFVEEQEFRERFIAAKTMYPDEASRFTFYRVAIKGNSRPTILGSFDGTIEGSKLDSGNACHEIIRNISQYQRCLLYTSPSPRDRG